MISSTTTPALIVSDVDADEDVNSSHSEGGESLEKSKDSGVECEPEPFVPPDEETAKKITSVVVFYLSDANILKDPFLLKHVRKNKEGFVSLKLITSFKKVRSLTRNWKAVAYSLQTSTTLALNSEGTKVRRLVPLPPQEETMSSRTVIVSNMPGSKVTIASLNSMFSVCGDISRLEVIRPETFAKPDFKRFLSKYPEFESKHCGLVEFEDFEGAKKALMINSDAADAIKVVPLLTKDSKGKPQCGDDTQHGENQPSPKKDGPKKKKKTKRPALHGSRKNLSLEDSESDAAYRSDRRSRRGSSGSTGYFSSSPTGYLSSSPVDDWFARRHSLNPSGKPLDPSKSLSFASFTNRGPLRGSWDRLNHSEHPVSLVESQSPWRRRRELMMMSESTPSLPSALLSSLTPVKILRHPRGPDGSDGFLPRNMIPLPTTVE